MFHPILSEEILNSGKIPLVMALKIGEKTSSSEAMLASDLSRAQLAHHLPPSSDGWLSEIRVPA